MLEVNADNSIVLTKGDTGTLNITVQGDNEIRSWGLKFTVRNAQNLDNEMFVISSASGETTDGAGTVSHVNGTNLWTININKGATENLKRKKYVYDFALEGSGSKITFVGGGKNKTEFWVT